LHNENLIKTYFYLHEPYLKIPEGQLDPADFLTYQIARDIVKTFIKYPLIENISLDFERLLRLSKVWEGSSEEIIENYSILWDKKDNILNSEDYINNVFYKGNEELNFYYYQQHYINKFNPQIKHYNFKFPSLDDTCNYDKYINNDNFVLTLYKNLSNELDHDFSYLTEESSFLENVLTYQKKNNILHKITFFKIKDGKYNDYLLEDLLNFVTPTIKLTLQKENLETILSHSVSTKSTKKI
jgi:hypothetical protein